MDAPRLALIDDVADLARLPLADGASFVRRYLAGVGLDDLAERSPAQIVNFVTAHVDSAVVRPRGEAVVSVDAAGVLDIVTDDMPFLVDSVTGHLHRKSIDIELLVHPQLSIERDGEDRLIGLGEGRTGDVAEAWMHFQLEPLTPEIAEGLAGEIEAVLRDVRLAVADWSALRGRALDLAGELEQGPPTGVDPNEVQDAVELLRWLTEDNFTFIGYREYSLNEGADMPELVAESDTALGIMRKDPRASQSFAALSPEARAIAYEPRMLVLTKANRRSTVHRTVYLDYVGVKKFDSEGRVVGEHRFLGLYAATAYSISVTDIPVVSRKVKQVLSRAGHPPQSHDGRDLLEFLQTYPRDELFEITVDQLVDISGEVLRMQDRRQTRAFFRYDEFGRFVSAMVYLPRDRYTTTVRERMMAVLTEAYGAESVDYTARVNESIVARLHFLVRVPIGMRLTHVDGELLEEQLATVARSWDDRFAAVLEEECEPDEEAALAALCDGAFPEAYKVDVHPQDALVDARIIAGLGLDRPMAVRLYRPSGAAAEASRRLSVYRAGAPVSLSEMLPVLQHLGVGVVDERPYRVDLGAAGPGAAVGTAWIYDFGLALPTVVADEDSLASRFEAAFVAGSEGRLDRDGFAGLVVTGGLTWRQVALVQALMAYVRQLGTAFSQRYTEQVLLGHGALVRDIVRLFEQRLDPAGPATDDDMALLSDINITARLDAITSLDEDRIVRVLLAVVLAVTRTNYFRRCEDGKLPDVIAVKLEPSRIPEAPSPRPKFEVWVHSPRVSGVHLRFGPVARGGLRWSDRREDFRTEVLGLVKAQMVKNAVIVPVGAKGGFVCANPGDPSDREAWLAEGIACYQLFVSALLDVTDNLVDGAVVPPSDVVRLDGDDPYLVVAADKGTATFSDIANAIALDLGFWLGDAFASGGSAGYDHKVMGITARGAWESVKRHFLGLGVDVGSQDFTVVGVGDMSGDVFGNGMLMSDHIRLVAAFDHRHVFLDPNPDPAVSAAERRRLFELPRSSWADYTTDLISEGGGVHSRGAKSIHVSPQVREVLGMDAAIVNVTPAELMRAILKAPVDLLWNGGIGTYVKATAESNTDVGDKANDAIRVNGSDLRCRVVGEGGNLGMTQRGRIEAARAGVLLNTDAIDNSAGVDTSDHEVNIKVLLDAAVRDGSLPLDARTPLLESMTDDVAHLVLRDNYEQNLLLATDLAQAPARIGVHRRLIAELEQRGELDRELDSLPTDVELQRRAEAGEALLSPELAVLLARVKIALTADLAPAHLVSEPWFARLLADYFPPAIGARFAERLGSHPLANDIVTTMVSNAMVNDGGITYPFRVFEETGATAVDLARAYVVATRVFDLPGLWSRIEALDNVAPSSAQTALLLESRRLLDRATRWMLQTRGHSVDVDAEIEAFRSEISRVRTHVPAMLRGAEAQRLEAHVERLRELGAPADLAAEVAVLLDLFSLLDVVEIARRLGQDAAVVADLYFAVSERYGGDLLLRSITALPRPDRWATLARAALRSDLYTALAALTSRISRATPVDLHPSDRIDRWETGQAEGISRARGTLAEITALETADIATLSVALRALRSLVAQGSSASIPADRTE